MTSSSIATDMTLKQAKRVAHLHGIPVDITSTFPQTPKAFLLECNAYLATLQTLSANHTRKRVNAFKRATNQKIPRGIPTKGHKKCVIAPYRHEHRARHWHEVKRALFNYCYITENCPKPLMRPRSLKTVAEFIGCSQSQVHRWICPVCEHDAEPSFSVGMAIIEFLDQYT